jgi:hypothetical protein
MRLSGFQKLMHSWERWHAVNAVQFVELRESVPLSRLRHAVEQLFSSLEEGSGGSTWRLGYGGKSPCFSEILDPDCILIGDTRDLECLITQLMNRPFTDSQLPVRCGIVETGSASFLWLCYRHSIADARSIAMLLRFLLLSLFTDRGCVQDVRAMNIGASMGEILQRRIRSSWWRSAAVIIQSLCALQKCARRPPQTLGDYSMVFRHHGSGYSLSSLQRLARCSGYTVGEILTAAVLEWQVKIGGNSRLRPWASQRCVSVLADVTSRVGPEWRGSFGQYICPLNVFHDCDSDSFEALLKVVRCQLQGTRQFDHAVRSLAGLTINSFLLKFLPGPLAQVDQELILPVGAAISNVNLNSLIVTTEDDLPIESYARSTCASQLSPVIVCLTTFRDSWTLTSTHFSACFADDEISGLREHLQFRLNGITRESDSSEERPAPLRVLADSDGPNQAIPGKGIA